MSTRVLPHTANKSKGRPHHVVNTELLATLASIAIADTLPLIENDFQIEVSLVDPQGKILWLRGTCCCTHKVATLLSNKMNQGLLGQLFLSPMEVYSKFYYLAPIYADEDKLLAIMILSTDKIKCNVLLALAHSLGREISEKLKNHFHRQKLMIEPRGDSLLHGFNVQEVERALIIEAALTYCGKIQEMHQALNMGRTTLWRKLKQYEINIKEYK